MGCYKNCLCEVCTDYIVRLIKEFKKICFLKNRNKLIDNIKNILKINQVMVLRLLNKVRSEDRREGWSIRYSVIGV